MIQHFLTTSEGTPLYLDPNTGIVKADVRVFNGQPVTYWALQIKERKAPEQWKQEEVEITIPPAKDLQHKGLAQFPPRTPRRKR